MATFFGEVLPVISRAVDEDDDEEETTSESQSSCFLRWSPSITEEIEGSKNKKLKCISLVIAVGKAANGFVQTYLLEQNTEKIGVICSGMKDHEPQSLSQNLPTDSTCYIHRHSKRKEIIMVTCNTEVSAEQSFSWTQQLLPFIDFTNCYVAILASSPACDYKTTSSYGELTMPLLRALKTPNFKGTPACPYLEQPNTITGLPAQVMTYCQIHEIPAVLYMCYTDVLELDSSQMKIFERILKSTPIKDHLLANPNAEELMGKLLAMSAAHSHIYI